MCAACGQCAACKAGDLAWCDTFGLQGGGYAEYALTRPNQCVILRTADQKILGTVLLFNFNRASASIELGYVLGQPHRRQGYAKEALAAVCHHVFANLGLRRIEAEVTSHNLASNALLLRLGFVREGCLRQRWVANGVAHDSHVYGCLAGEWARPVGVEDTRVCT